MNKMVKMPSLIIVSRQMCIYMKQFICFFNLLKMGSFVLSTQVAHWEKYYIKVTRICHLAGVICAIMHSNYLLLINSHHGERNSMDEGNNSVNNFLLRCYSKNTYCMVNKMLGCVKLDSGSAVKQILFLQTEFLKPC